jgi:hypothetical protein
MKAAIYFLQRSATTVATAEVGEDDEGDSAERKFIQAP